MMNTSSIWRQEWRAFQVVRSRRLFWVSSPRSLAVELKNSLKAWQTPCLIGKSLTSKTTKTPLTGNQQKRTQNTQTNSATTESHFLFVIHRCTFAMRPQNGESMNGSV